MAAVKTRPRIGDVAYFVEWCAEVPVDENGDSDMDNVDDRRERFADHETAIARAREVLPLDAFGCVTIVRSAFVPYDDADAVEFPHAGFWQDDEYSIEEITQ